VTDGAWSNQLNNLIILAAQQLGFSGLFAYSPAPGAGNLIASISAVAGTDPYGNAYRAGLTTYDSFGDLANLTAQTLTLHNAGAEFRPAQVTGGGGTLLLISGQDNPADVALIAQFLSRNTSVSGISGGLFLAEDTGAIAATARILELAGSIAMTGNAHRVVAGAEETFHTLTLQNGWTANAPALQYRRVVVPPNEVELIGDISAGTITNGTQIANALPASYQPVTGQSIPVITVGNTASPVRTPIATITAAGILSVFGLPTGTTSIRFPAGSGWSLDAT
jgi:hypothetical protein